MTRMISCATCGTRCAALLATGRRRHGKVSKEHPACEVSRMLVSCGNLESTSLPAFAWLDAA